MLKLWDVHDRELLAFYILGFREIQQAALL